MELFTAICLGIGLSAACGFRVFIPPFLLGISVRLGWMDASSGLEWVGGDPALVLLGTAAVMEIIAYYVPWLDNALDAIATPASIFAGVLMTAFSLEGFDPWIQWSVALLGGGAAASVIQVFTGFLRLIISSATAGLGNWVQSTVEALSASIMSLLAITVPVAAMVLAVVIIIFILRRPRKWRKHADEG